MGYCIYIKSSDGGYHLGKSSYGWPFMLNFTEFMLLVKRLCTLDVELKRKFLNFETHWMKFKNYYDDMIFFDPARYKKRQIYSNREKLIDWAKINGFVDRGFIKLSGENNLDTIVDRLRKYFFPAEYFNHNENLQKVLDQINDSIKNNTPENRTKLGVMAEKLLGIKRINKVIYYGKGEQVPEVNFPCVIGFEHNGTSYINYNNEFESDINVVIQNIYKNIVPERLSSEKKLEFEQLIDKIKREDDILLNDYVLFHQSQSVHPSEMSSKDIFKVLECAIKEMDITFIDESNEKLTFSEIKNILSRKKNFTGKDLIKRTLPDPKNGIIQGKIEFMFCSEFD